MQGSVQSIKATPHRSPTAAIGAKQGFNRSPAGLDHVCCCRHHAKRLGTDFSNLSQARSHMDERWTYMLDMIHLLWNVGENLNGCSQTLHRNGR